MSKTYSFTLRENVSSMLAASKKISLVIKTKLKKKIDEEVIKNYYLISHEGVVAFLGHILIVDKT